MNKITTILLSLVVISVSSCKSKEDKANEFIKNEMFKTLYDFSSYEPIETIVDSAFTSIYTDSTILTQAFGLEYALEKTNEYIDAVKSAKSIMEIWKPDHYSSNYAYSKYNEALNEYNKNLELANTCVSLADSLSREVLTSIKKFQPEFIGWEAIHKFRCKNKGGNYSLGNYSYVFDPDFKYIIRTDDLDDESFIKIKKTIDEYSTYSLDDQSEDVIKE